MRLLRGDDSGDLGDMNSDAPGRLQPENILKIIQFYKKQ